MKFYKIFARILSDYIIYEMLEVSNSYVFKILFPYIYCIINDNIRYFRPDITTF